MMKTLPQAMLLAIASLAAGDALAAPDYQMPFACGEAWRLATFSNHNPQLAVDMNRTNDFGHPVRASAGALFTVPTVVVDVDLADALAACPGRSWGASFWQGTFGVPGV